MARSPETFLYITDKNGGKHFKTTCSTAYKYSEIRNLERHLQMAAKFPGHYKFIDLESAHIVDVDQNNLLTN
jgi:hypothetical protein